MDTLKKHATRWLKWLERYTKTDMLYLAHGGFWLGLDQIASSGATFLISLAFANLLAPEIYGTYKYILSITSVLLITTLTGMDSAVTQSVARGYEGTLEVSSKIKIKFGTIGSLLSLVFAGYYLFQGNSPLAICFCIIALCIPFGEAFDIYNSLLAGKRLFKVQAIYDVIRNIIIVVVLVGTLLITHNIYFIILAYFLSLVIPNILFFYRAKKHYQENNQVDPHVIEYGKHLSIIYVIGTLLGELDKILVFHYVGAADLAIYTLASAPTDQVKGLLKNVNSLAIPRFSQRSTSEIKKGLASKILMLVLFVSAIVLCYIFLAPYFFSFFFPKYIASIHYSQVLSLSLIPVIISGFLYTILESQKSKKELYQYNIYSNVINIIVLLPLVYYFGIWGAIASRMITRFFSLGLIGILIDKIA